MTREEKIRDIGIVCDKNGCTEKQRARHYRLFVEEDWQPHVSLRFKKWWFEQQEFKDSQNKEEGGEGIAPVAAQNVKRIWDAYLDAKEVGAA